VDSDYRDIGTFEGLSGFEGAIGKLGRAKNQLQGLNKRFITYAESQPYRCVEKFDLRPDQEIGDYRYVIESISMPKREWGVLIGELIHNLRSALDHCIYAAAQRPSRDNQFPIFTEREDWDKKAKRMLRSVPKEVVVLVEERQPYHATPPQRPDQHLLAVLNRLSNHDKHRLLHTAVTTVQNFASPRFDKGRDVAAIHNAEFVLGPMKEGADLVRVSITPSGPNPEVNMHGNFALGVAFTDPKGEDRVIEGADILAMLLAIYRLVWDTAVRIEVAVKHGPTVQ
jgi:hypothetical protein